MFKFWKELGTEVLGEIVGTGIMGALIQGLRNSGAAIGEAVGRKVAHSLEDFRAQLLGFLQWLEIDGHRVEAQTLFRRQTDRQLLRKRSYGPHEPYRPGEENKMVKLLTKLYRSLDEESRREERTELFIWLGSLDDERFDAVIELLSDDGFAQGLIRLKQVTRETIKSLGLAVGTGMETVVGAATSGVRSVANAVTGDTAQAIDTTIATGIHGFTNWLFGRRD